MCVCVQLSDSLLHLIVVLISAATDCVKGASRTGEEGDFISCILDVYITLMLAYNLICCINSLMLPNMAA